MISCMYRCGPVDTYKDTCTISTKRSKSPFSIPAGHVIYNRTSGSTSPNNAETVSATTTVTATATVTASISSSTYTAPSSRKNIAIATGISGFLDLVLLIAIELLWKQGKHKRNVSKDMRTRQEKYTEMKKIVELVEKQQYQASHQVLGSKPGELDEPQHLSRHLRAGEAGEVDGAQLYKLAEKAGRA